MVLVSFLKHFYGILKVVEKSESDTALNLTARKKILSKSTSLENTLIGLFLFLILTTYTVVIFFGEFFIIPKNEEVWCKAAQQGYLAQGIKYENPDYNSNPCRYERTAWLLYCTLEECDISRRMALSIVYGSIMGFERKVAERPVGIRTMSLVCLGACFFTINSMIAFRSSTMDWDAARVAAAIPSGVGFLGASLIWKGSSSSNSGENREVRGLTTAASIWLSSAIGVGLGGNLVVLSSYALALVIIILRFGPRNITSTGGNTEKDSGNSIGEASDDHDTINADETYYDCNKSSMTPQDSDNVTHHGQHEDDSLLLSSALVEITSNVKKTDYAPLRDFDDISPSPAFHSRKMKPRRKVRSLSPRALLKKRNTPMYHE